MVLREASLRHDIVHVCHLLYQRGLIAGPDGNVSARLSADEIVVTPAGFSKGELTPDDLVLVSATGRQRGGTHRPSSELAMHLRVYRRREDIHAVVHAHPPTATAFAVAGKSFVTPPLPEIILQMGEVALVPYETPGTEALADRMEPFLADHDALLLANHGATTLGATLREAHQRMESLEHVARILLAARLLGTPQPEA